MNATNNCSSFIFILGVQKQITILVLFLSDIFFLVYEISHFSHFFNAVKHDSTCRKEHIKLTILRLTMTDVVISVYHFQ